MSFSDAHHERFAKIGAEDALIGRPFPRIPSEPSDFFRLWLTTPAAAGQADGLPGLSYFDFETGFWAERHRANLLLVHYQDLLDDRDGEMRRIARFLDIDPDERLWPSLVHAAGFSAMQAVGNQLMPELSNMFNDGAGHFFNKGTNGRWRDAFALQDLALYELKVREKFSRNLAAWLSSGRRATGDPEFMD